MLYTLLTITFLAPASLAIVDCYIACTRCLEQDWEYPGILEVYCAMCKECRDRRKEHQLRMDSDSEQQIIHLDEEELQTPKIPGAVPEGCPTPPPCELEVSVPPPPATLAQKITTTRGTTTTTTCKPTTCPTIPPCKKPTKPLQNSSSPPPRCSYPCMPMCPCPYPYMQSYLYPYVQSYPQQYSTSYGDPQMSEPVHPQSDNRIGKLNLAESSTFAKVQKMSLAESSTVAKEQKFNLAESSTVAKEQEFNLADSSIVAKPEKPIYVYVGVPKDILAKAKDQAEYI